LRSCAFVLLAKFIGLCSSYTYEMRAHTCVCVCVCVCVRVFVSLCLCAYVRVQSLGSVSVLLYCIIIYMHIYIYKETIRPTLTPITRLVRTHLQILLWRLTPALGSLEITSTTGLRSSLPPNTKAPDLT
jgi:hypothetical protein